MSKLTSLIIVNYNSRPYLENCLSSLIGNTHSPFEIIIVDNGSADGSLSFLQQLRDGRIKTIINESNRGYAAACNQGLRVASGHFFATMNPDVLVPPGWLSRLIWHLQNNPRTLMVGPKGIGIGGRQAAGKICFSQRLSAADRKFSGLNHRRSTVTKFLIGCLILFDRRLLQTIGYFDEALTLGADDFDLALRLRMAGYQLRVAEDVLIRHRIHASFDSSSPDQCRRLAEESWRHFKRKWCSVLQQYGWRRLFEDEKPIFPGDN